MNSPLSIEQHNAITKERWMANARSIRAMSLLDALEPTVRAFGTVLRDMLDRYPEQSAYLHQQIESNSIKLKELESIREQFKNEMGLTG